MRTLWFNMAADGDKKSSAILDRESCTYTACYWYVIQPEWHKTKFELCICTNITNVTKEYEYTRQFCIIILYYRPSISFYILAA